MEKAYDWFLCVTVKITFQFSFFVTFSWVKLENNVTVTTSGGLFLKNGSICTKKGAAELKQGT